VYGRRKSLVGVPHPRKVQLFQITNLGVHAVGDTTLLENDEAPDVSDDEELYAPSETF